MNKRFVAVTVVVGLILCVVANKLLTEHGGDVAAIDTAPHGTAVDTVTERNPVTRADAGVSAPHAVDYLDGVARFRDGSVAPVLRLASAEHAVEELRKKTGLRVTLTDPHETAASIPSYTYNCVDGRNLLVQEVRRAKGAGRAVSAELTRVVDLAAEFAPDVVAKKGGLPLATRVISTEPPTGAFDGMFVAYYFNVKDGVPEESIKWIDTTLLASPDVLALMWVRELGHALYVRDMVHREEASLWVISAWKKVLETLQTNRQIQKEFSEAANPALVEAYRLFMQEGVLGRTTMRTAVDVRVLIQLADMETRNGQ